MVANCDHLRNLKFSGHPGRGGRSEIAICDLKTESRRDISAAIPHLLRLPAGRTWIDYDEEADVLYISLKRPQRATDTVDRNGVLLRYRGKELVGITVLNASKRTENGKNKR